MEKNINLIKFINEKYFKEQKNKLKIHKKNNSYKIEIEFSKDKIFYDNSNDIKKFEECVKEFLITLYNNCENFNHKNFLYNFKNAFFYIEKGNGEELISGSVEKTPDKIIYKIKTFNGCFHELLHLSVLPKKRKLGVLNAGFECFKNSFDVFGKGLNEGYTQLLAARYFGEIKGNPYPYEVAIARKIENLVGKEKMEKFYFNSDLEGLFEELRKYENAYVFIRKIDILHNNNFVNSTTFENSDKQLFLTKLKEVYLLLLKMYINKIIYLKDKNLDYFYLYIYLMNSNNWIDVKTITYKGEKYVIKTMEEEDYNNVINEFLLMDSTIQNKKVK